MNDAQTSMVTAKSSLDFSGLGELRAKTERNDRAALKETAQQFEAMMIRQMLKSMRDASNVLKSDLTSSHAQDMFEGMFDQEVAVQLSKRNQLGLSDMLVRHLDQMQAQPSTQDVLNQRGQAAKAMPLQPAPSQAVPMQTGDGKTIARPLPPSNTRAMPLRPTLPFKGELK